MALQKQENTKETKKKKKKIKQQATQKQQEKTAKQAPKVALQKQENTKETEKPQTKSTNDKKTTGPGRQPAITTRNHNIKHDLSGRRECPKTKADESTK